MTLENGETFTGTTNHPVWVPARHHWLSLEELEVGLELDATDGPPAIKKIKRKEQVADVFNIEVHGHHVYRIEHSGILVHNAYQNNAQKRTMLEVLEARKLKIIESSPIQIPGNAVIRFRTSGSGAIEARYTWNNSAGQKFVARFHDPSPGAPSGSLPSWVVERITPGNSTGTRRVTEIFLGDDIWIKQGTWYKYIEAYRNGTATEGMLNILRRSHFPVE